MVVVGGVGVGGKGLKGVFRHSVPVGLNKIYFTCKLTIH